MPYSPPSRDHKHPAVGREACEDGCAEKQHKTQSRVLDSCLNGEGSAILFRHLEYCSYAESDAKGKQVVYEDHNEYVFDALQESVQVSGE